MLIDNIDLRTANVYGIYGHLGGGKTLTAVELSLDFLRMGWTVASNVRLFHVDCMRGKYQFIEDFADVDAWELPVGAPRGSSDSFRSVIIVDECAEFFDQYSSSSPQVKRFLSWLRHSSKRGQFVFLIVQQPEFIAKSLRLLINKWIVCLDMQQLRLPVFRCRLPFASPFVMRRVLDRYGNVISRGWCMCNKFDVGYYYNTAQSIATEGRGVDTVSISDKPPLPGQQTMFVLGLLYIIWLFYWF